MLKQRNKASMREMDVPRSPDNFATRDQEVTT
jgi:hypothetical protein